MVKNDKTVNECARATALRWVLNFLLVLVVVLGLKTASIAQERISVGLRSQDWFFMWPRGQSLAEQQGLNASEKLRWQITEANLKRYKELGAEWNLVILVQGEDGPDGFMRARRAVREYQRYGVQPVFRIIENPAVYRTLRRIPDEAFGFSRTYYDWVRAIAEQFRNDVRLYLIGNEIDSDLSLNLHGKNRQLYTGFRVSYVQYEKLIFTGHKAIKEVDSKLKVADHGVSGFAHGLAVADDLIRQGRLGEAQRFWNEFHFNRRNIAWAAARLSRLLSDSSMQRRIKIARNTFLRSKYCDYVQLHYYGGWKALQSVIDWTQKTMIKGGNLKPIIATEIGYARPTRKGSRGRVPDMEAFSQEDHAVNLVKSFTTLISYGVSMIEYWQMRSTNPDAIPAPLYKAADRPECFEAYRAAEALRVLAVRVNGSRIDQLSNPVIENVHITTLKGDRKLSILWADGNAEIPKSMFSGLTRIEGIYGRPNLGADGKIMIGSQPIYVHW